MNVQEALAAVRDNPNDDESPLPWRADDTFVFAADGTAAAHWVKHSRARHIAAAVNAAPVLAAEVERLQGLLAAARWKVEQLPRYEEHMCTIEVLGANDLDLANEALDRARRAVGLEESHG